MNILRELNQARAKTKNQKFVMTKVKFGTNTKTKNCTFCGMPGTKIRFGNENRTLCKNHIMKLNAKHEKFDVTSDTFKKANKL